MSKFTFLIVYFSSIFIRQIIDVKAYGGVDVRKNVSRVIAPILFV